MLEMLSNIFSHPLVGNIVGVIGIVSALLFYMRSKRTAKPSFQRFSLRLLGGTDSELPPEVTVLFENKKIDRLTRTTLIFWNNGTEVLYGDKIVESDKMKISFDKGNTILDHKILKTTKKANAFSAQHMENGNSHQLLVDFSYLDPRDGAVVELLHNSKKRYPKVHGSIMGLPKGFEDLGIVYAEDAQLVGAPSFARFVFGNRRRVLWIVFIVSLAFAGFGAIPTVRWEVVAAGVAYAAMTAVLLWLRRKRYPKALRID